MPIIGLICEHTHEQVSFKHCLDCAKTRQQPCNKFPYECLRGMIKQIKPRENVSVTTLESCPVKYYLDTHMDYYVYPSDLYFTFRGIEFHTIAQKYKKRGCIVEKPLSIEIAGSATFVIPDIRGYNNGNVLSGTPDIIDVKANMIIDIKTTKQVNLAWNINKSFIWQLNRYRWLTHKVTGFLAKHLQFHYYDFVQPAIRNDCEIKDLDEVEQETYKKYHFYLSIRQGKVPSAVEARKIFFRLCRDYCSKAISDKCYEMLLEEMTVLDKKRKSMLL